MQVTYNGFTGELVKLEATHLSSNKEISSTYDLSIYEREKNCEHNFKCVKLEDVRFLGGEVSFK